MAGDSPLPSCIASLRTLLAVSAMQRLLGSLAPVKTAGSVHRRSGHPIANRFHHSCPRQLDCRPIPDHRLSSGSPTRAYRGARSGAAAADVGLRLLAPSRLAWLTLGFAAAFCSAQLHGLLMGHRPDRSAKPALRGLGMASSSVWRWAVQKRTARDGGGDGEASRERSA
jgi:hypothetical protein